MTSIEAFPVAIIGGGPIGLAAAAQLHRRGIPTKLYEAGGEIAANVRDWAHVRFFSPWRYSIDEAARALLERNGWTAPPIDEMPLGRDLIERYLAPLAATPELAPIIETNARVTAVTRRGLDKVGSFGRDERPFSLTVETAAGTRRDPARAVIDASGTWATPNPLGADGLLAGGESCFGESIYYGIPDVLGRDRESYRGRTVLVVGAGHSAANALLDLAELAKRDVGLSILWATRKPDLSRVYGGGENDQLPARAELGAGLQALERSGRIASIRGFSITALRAEGARIVVEGDTPEGARQIGPVDRIIVATGQRPDLALTRELRLDLDPWLESVRALGPLIDPNLHSCGSVPPHGHREVSHPEPGFYTVGIKSYGRAPTFLLLTGYEQVRSVAAALAGDMADADAVRLVLPETGVCTINRSVDAGQCATPEVTGKRCCGSAA